MKKLIFIATMIAILGSMGNEAYAATQNYVTETTIPGRFAEAVATGKRMCYETDSLPDCHIVKYSYEVVNNVIDFSSQRVAVIDNIEGATDSTLNATIDIEPNYTSEFDPETGATIYHFGLKPTSRRTTEAEAWDWLLRVIE